MKLTKLNIHNFRGFEQESVNLSDITVFIGENNTGKSSVLDALRLCLGNQGYVDKISRFDYRLLNNKSYAGDAGEISIRVEVCEPTVDAWPDEIQQTLPDPVDLSADGRRNFFMNLKGSFDKTTDRSTEVREFQTANGVSKGAKANTSKNFLDFRNLLPVFYISSLRDASKEFQQKRGLFRSFLENETIPPAKRTGIEQ
ncbi:MAG TPA: AAA family ATPase, partial [Turneriella sp.]|nr:AAA family ATPase [Turneriella sp.]